MTDARIPYAEQRALVQRIFAAHGLPEPGARIMADTVAEAERDACLSHGLFRMETGALGAG